MFSEAEGIPSPGKKAGRKPADFGVLFKCKWENILLCQMGLVARMTRTAFWKVFQTQKLTQGCLRNLGVVTTLPHGSHKGHCRVRNGDNHPHPRVRVWFPLNPQ